MTSRVILASIAMLALSACGLQPYRMPPNTPNARINVASAQSTWICKTNLPAQRLVPDQQGYAQIPAGESLTVGASFFASGYNVNYSCYPRSSFVPEVGKAYYLDFQIDSEHCTAFVYKEAPEKPAGLDFENSFHPGGYCAAAS